MTPAASSHRPSKEELQRAAGATVPDVLANGLAVLFCGINPGLYSGAVGHHFARPGNRFFKVLHLSGLTTTELRPNEEQALLDARLGITNVVARASATASELSRDELREGAVVLRDKVARVRPAVVAVLGLGAYRTAFDRRAPIGPQELPLTGAPTWVLPNPSGLQARYQLDELVSWFAALRAAAFDDRSG